MSGCSCNNDKKAMATATKVTIFVRDGSTPLACRDCLEKHVAKAAVLAVEWLEDQGRDAERLLCIGNLSCASDHARALGESSVADRIDRARPDDGASILRILARCGDEKELAVGSLAAAESHLRLCGMYELADQTRHIRLSIREKILESQRGVGIENKAEPAPSEEQ